jgi:two-component system cell cycle sensor histidine kinase/response regulator CckA
LTINLLVERITVEDERKTKKQLIEELNCLRLEQIEQTRVASEKFTKAFLQNSIPTIITSVKDGNVIEVSDSFLRLVGLKRHEVIGHTSTEGGFLTNEQRVTFFNELKKNGRIENLEMEVRPSNRTLRYGLFNAVMMSISNENCLLTTIQDITDRKQMEEVLAKSEEKLRLITENMVDCVALVDTNGTFQYVSPSTRETLGYDLEDMIGITGYSITHPDDLEEITRLFPKDNVHSRGETNYDTRLRHKDGHYVSLEVRARTLIDPEGKRMGSVLAARDITDRKKAETEKATLEYQNRQLQKSESLGRMAGAIAHHFNNQLGVVIGNLEMAIDEQPKGAPPAKSLTSAMEAAWKSADMSGLMLTYLGQTHDKCEPLDLSYSCRKILPLIKTTLPGNVVMETDFTTPRPIIMANAGEIQQILNNLITNAREAIGSNKGTISLSVKTASPAEIPTAHRHPIDWQPRDKAYACLEVTDTGCGIEDKDIEQLFDPFFTDKFTGRGMGLPVVLGIVKACKGVITVDSKPGSGSTFRLFFPVSEEALAQPQTTENDIDITISAPSSRKMEEGGTVLVVEDDEALRKLITIMLERLGFSVLEAQDGVEALKVFGPHQSEIQFVITDLTMPRMDGWETLTALRKLDPDIPVILASGYDLAHVMAGDHPELPQAFLAKPYNLTALNNAIRQAIESKGKTEGKRKDE